MTSKRVAVRQKPHNNTQNERNARYDQVNNPKRFFLLLPLQSTLLVQFFSFLIIGTGGGKFSECIKGITSSFTFLGISQTEKVFQLMGERISLRNKHVLRKAEGLDLSRLVRGSQEQHENSLLECHAELHHQLAFPQNQTDEGEWIL